MRKASVQPLPAMSGAFWAYALAGGLSQILATMCVVALFAERNFAVGITFKKTEVIQTAIVGYLVLGEGLSRAGVAGGSAGLSSASSSCRIRPAASGGSGSALTNRAAGLGLLSGVFFAVSAVGYRGASLSLGSGDTALRAGFTLAVVTASQTVGDADLAGMARPGADRRGGAGLADRGHWSGWPAWSAAFAGSAPSRCKMRPM